MEEFQVDENKILNELSEVTTAKRKASMFMHDADVKAKQRKIKK